MGTKFTADNTGNLSIAGYMNIASGQTYRINNTQIAASDLSDGANLAHINAAESISGSWTFSQSPRLNDNVQLQLGTDNDSRIYHSGVDGFWDFGTGSFSLRLNSTENAIVASVNGAVSLYHDNNLKLATAAGGVNVTGLLAATSLSGTGAGITTLNASNISTGTLGDARLSGNVTLQGNTFNGASQLVQLTAGTQYPALSGALITALNASNISSGSLADARLSANVMLESDLTTEGDIFYRNASATVRLGRGTTGQVLTSTATTINWANPASSGHVIEDEGTPVTQRNNLNFTGLGVSVADNVDTTDVTIPGVARERQELTATGGQSVFNFTGLANNLADDITRTLVYLNGKLMQDGPGNDYDITGAKQITFDATSYPTGLVAGDKVWVLALNAESTLVSYTAGTVTTRRYVYGTASGNNYAGGKIVALENGDSYTNTGHFLAVYHNGQKLRLGDDYTEDGATQFTIAAGRTMVNGDIIEAQWLGVTGSLGTQTEERYDEVVSGTAKSVFTPGFNYSTGGKSVYVYVDGVLKRPGAGNDYEETGGGTTITFATPIPVSSYVAIITRLQGSAGNADTVDGYHAQGIIDAAVEATVHYAMLFGN